MSRDLRDELANVHEMLDEIFNRASKLQNKNLADIAASARGRVQQLRDHPDTDLIVDEKHEADKFDPNAPTTKEEAVKRMQDDGDADPEGTAKLNWPHLFEPAPLPQQ